MIRGFGGGRRPATPKRPRRPKRPWRGRLLLVGLVYAAAMSAVAARFGDLASGHDPAFAAETARQAARARTPAAALERRPEIVDRNGAPLAVGVRAYELYYDASKAFFPDEAAEAAERLAAALGLDAADLARRFARGGLTLVKRPATPREAQAAHDLGLPGLFFTPRIERVAVGGPAFAHLIGHVDIDGIGRSGLEGALEPRLRARAEPGPPVALTVDARAQRQTRAALADAMRATGARAAAAVILDADTGAVRALVSLPDFDPARPPAPSGAPIAETARYSRAVAGLYELGSTFKIFTWALALEAGHAVEGENFDAPTPFRVGGHLVRDDHPIRGPVDLAGAFAKSSNIVAAKLALRAGPERHRRFLESLGFGGATALELVEAAGAAPLFSDPWNPTASATASYGYGVAVSPLHLAAATAAVVNGGWRVSPTLLEPGPEALGRRPRVLSRDASATMRRLLRKVVVEGTGKRAEVPGLEVGGKTGTADKPDLENGGYHKDKVIATFAAAYPMSRPRFVVVAMLDEAETPDGRRSSALTAAPAVKAIIERTAPLLGVAPMVDPALGSPLETAEVPEGGPD